MPTEQESLAEFRDRAAAFLDSSVESGIACPDFGSIMPPGMFDRAREWQRHLFANGFAGLHWPVEYGGQGLPIEFHHVWTEECARLELASYMNFQGFVLAGPAILEFGTDEQKAKYLRPTLAAEIVWCQLFSEPGSGSDLVSLRTRAEADGDGWLVTGQKVWSSTAQLAQHGILLARTDRDDPGHRGISFFLFDMTGPGTDVRPLKQMTGDEEFCEVFLDGAPVAAGDLLGPRNGGWTVAASVLANERSAVGAAGIGLERRTANLLAELADHHDHPVLRDRVVEIAVTAGATRRLLDRSAGDPLLGPLVKLAMTEFETTRTGASVDMLGPAGAGVGDRQEAFLYAPGMRVAGGTSEIQRNLIGERLLGLPREPKAD